MKTAFGDIAKKSQMTEEEFLAGAKVDNQQPVPEHPKAKDKKLDPGARRGASYKNKDGKTVILGGRNLPVPLNAYELDAITKAANEVGIPISSFVRMAALEKAKK